MTDLPVPDRMSQNTTRVWIGRPGLRKEAAGTSSTRDEPLAREFPRYRARLPLECCSVLQALLVITAGMFITSVAGYEKDVQVVRQDLRIPGAAFMNHLGGGTHGLLKPANASSHVVICMHGAGMDFLDTQMMA